MAIFRGFKPQAMQKIAGRLGYTGSMANFDSYLEQNPDKKREMIVFQEAAKEMAKGGVVKMQTGGLFGAGLGGIGNTRVLGSSVGSLGAPSYVSPIMPPTDPNNPLGPVGAAVMRYGYNPTTNQYSISGGGGQQFPEGFESSMNYGDLYKKYPQIKGVFERGRPQPKTLQDMMVGEPGPPIMTSPGFDPRYEGRNAQDYGQRNQIPVGTGGFGQEGFDIEKARQVTPDPRLLELERNFRGAATMDVQARLRPDGSLYMGSSSMFGDIYGQGGSYQQTYPSGLVDPRDPEPIAVTPPAQAPSSDAGSIGQVSADRLFNPTLPTGATVTPFGVPVEQGQMISPVTGQVAGTVSVPTTMSQTTMTNQPTVQQANLMNAQDVATQVNSSLDTLQTATTVPNDPRAQVLAAQQTASSVGNLASAQGNAILMTNPMQRQIQAGELIDSVANADKASKFTEQVQAATASPTDKATVAGQLATLTANFDATNPPAWAAGAIRGVQAVMQQRGLGASSIAGQALIQAAMESAIPIAQADARTVATFETQNLSNRQQRAMLSAQQRAAFIGQEFDQAFQARVQNASRISDIANVNFTAEQQIGLENSRTANTLNLNNLSNRQALVMAEASALANLDTANLSMRQQSAVQNAQNFLQLEMANLSNKQQSELFKAQQRTQALFTDQAADNASRQFNASSQNQVDQFFANLGTQVAQFNATQANAQAQFNAGQANTVERFNAELNNQRDQFNAQNQLVIGQSNAQWRRQIATADTAAVNRANELNANSLLGISKEAYDNLWTYYADTMEWAWTSAESELDRINKLATSNIQADSLKEARRMEADAKAASGLGGMVGTILTAGKDSLIGGWFS